MFLACMKMVFGPYRDLIVWQKAVELTKETYTLANTLPAYEQFRLASQIRAAASSIPANIAEGRNKGTKKEFRRYLRHAYSSGAELETHIITMKNAPFGGGLFYDKVDDLLDQVMRMLNVMIRKLGD